MVTILFGYRVQLRKRTSHVRPECFHHCPLLYHGAVGTRANDADLDSAVNALMLAMVLENKDLFDGIAMEVLKIPYRASRVNARRERFLGSVRRECLDHLLILTDGQLYRAIREYVGYFNHARSHQGIHQQIPVGEPVAAEGPPQGEVIRFPGLPGRAACERTPARKEVALEGSPVKGKIIAFPVLNGLHHDYRRVA